MKNASVYEKKIKKLLSGMPRVKPLTIEDPAGMMLAAILLPDAHRKSVQQAADALIGEFVDFNEMRVAPVKELSDHIGRTFPESREKAVTIVRSLNVIFDKVGKMSLDYMKEMSRKDLRRHLAEIGLSPFTAGQIMLHIFGLHAMPVDVSLVDALKMGECIDPGCTVEDAQAFLERVIAQKDDLSAHEFFRGFVEKNLKAIAKWRKANTTLATKPPEILPPPKFQMLAKSQPLPKEEGFEGEVEEVVAEVVLDEVIDEVAEEAVPEDIDDIELPVVEEGELEIMEGGEPKPPAKPGKQPEKPAKSGKPAAKSKKPGSGERLRAAAKKMAKPQPKKKK